MRFNPIVKRTSQPAAFIPTPDSHDDLQSIMARRRAASERSNSDAFDPFASDRRMNKYSVERQSSTDSEMFQKLQRRRRIAEGEEEPSSYQSPRHNKHGNTDRLKHVGMSPEVKARLQARLNIPSDDSNSYKSPRSIKQSDKGRFKHVPLNSEVESKLLVQLRKSSRTDSKKSFMSSDEFDVRSLGSDASFVENYEGGSTIVVDESSSTEEDEVDSHHGNSASGLDELQDSQRTDENEDLNQLIREDESNSEQDDDDNDDDVSENQRNDNRNVRPSNIQDIESQRSHNDGHSCPVDDHLQDGNSDDEVSSNHDDSDGSSHRSNRSDDDEQSQSDGLRHDDVSNSEGEHSDSRTDDDGEKKSYTQEDDEKTMDHSDVDDEENGNYGTFDDNRSTNSGDDSSRSVHDQFSRNMQREESGFSYESEQSQDESQYSRERNSASEQQHCRGVRRGGSGFSVQSDDTQESNFSAESNDNRPKLQRGKSDVSTESNDSRESQYSREEEGEDESGQSHSQSDSEAHSHDTENSREDEEYDDEQSYEASKCEDSFFAAQTYSDMVSIGTTGVDRNESFFSQAQTAQSAREEEPLHEIIEESEESESMVGDENSQDDSRGGESQEIVPSSRMVTGETGQGSESSMLEAAFEASFSMIDDNFNEQNDTMYPNDDDILGGSVVLEDQKEGLESIAEEDEEDDDELKPRTCQEAESDFFGRLMRGSRLRKQTSYSEESMQMEAIGTILDSVPEEQSKELSSRLFSDSIHESSRSAFKSIASLEPEGINCDEEMQMVESIGCESDAYEHEDVETNSRDLESEKPKRKQGDCCSLWFWIIVTVALVSVCTGLGIGLFFLGGSQSENDESNLSSNGTVPDKETETSAPGDVPSDPVLTNLTPEQLNVYNLLCPKLEDCTSLLNMFMPQGQAFDWLTNDKTANPDLNKMSDETKTQRYALATFYYATNGNYWTNKTGWLSSESECKWFSSTALPCDANGRLIALELDNNQVQGQLPFEISLLTSLKTISIQNPGGSRPFLNGSLPSSLGSTISLRSIDLSGNQFSGLIPSELGSLVNLESLDLSDNSLSGEIPPSFALLGKMTVFDISGNKLTGINTLFFEGKLTLSELNISRNRLEDLPPSTGRLLSLRTLNLAQNSFSTFPLEVTELLFLSSLDFSGNSITGQIPVHLGRMNALQNLNLSNNKFVGNIPVEIGNLVDMTESLNLSGNGLQGSIPSALGNLVSLQRLLLNGNQFGGSIPSELASLTEILEIRLDDNILTGQVPVALCQLYNKTEPMAFADCAELTLAECFNYCCKDVTGCTCRWESTDPFRCMA